MKVFHKKILTLFLCASCISPIVSLSASTEDNRYERWISIVLGEYGKAKEAYLKFRGAMDLKPGDSQASLDVDTFVRNSVIYSYYSALFYFLYKDVKNFYDKLDELYEEKKGIEGFEYRNLALQAGLKYALPLGIYFKAGAQSLPASEEIMAIYLPLLIATRCITPSLYWALEETTKTILGKFFSAGKAILGIGTKKENADLVAQTS